MKLLNNLLLTILLHIVIMAQGEDPYPNTEFTIQIQNATNRTIVFEIIPIGANWAKTTGCNISLYNDNTTYTSTLYGDTLGYVDCPHNGFNYRKWSQGNETIVFNCAQPTAGIKPIRNGFYQLNVRENNVLKTYAYFDWRDLGFPNSCNTCTGGNDFTIRYDSQYEEIWFWNENGITNGRNDPDFNRWTNNNLGRFAVQ